MTEFQPIQWLARLPLWFSQIDSLPTDSGPNSISFCYGDLWPGRDRGAARQARQRGGPDNRVEEFGAASLPAANQASRFADCRRLSCRDQYASGAVGPLGRLWRRGQQRYGEPGVAEGER